MRTLTKSEWLAGWVSEIGGICRSCNTYVPTANPLQCPGGCDLEAAYQRAGWISDTIADAPAAARPALIPQWRCLSDVAEEEVAWLVDGIIPAGMLTLFAGATGIGKSQTLAALCADVTHGRPFAGRRVGGGPGMVLYIQAEDDEHCTLKPRLRAAGALPERVLTMTRLEDTASGQSLRVQFPDHAAAVEQLINEVGITLVIIDPVISFGRFRGSGEPSAHEVRAVTDALIDVARNTMAAIVLVMHTRKDLNGSALSAVRGSGAWTESCRSVLSLGVHPTDPDRRILAHAKSNLSPTAQSAEFVIEPVGSVSRMAYCGASRMTADELHHVQRVEERTAMNDACDLLREALEDGPRPGPEIAKLAEERGISPATLNRAKRQLGILSGGKGRRGAAWQMPGGGANVIPMHLEQAS